MKTYDFAFVYEVKAREFDSVCLLAAELERRGYSTYVLNTWDRVVNLRRKIKAAVVFTFAAYSKGTIDYISEYVEGFKRVINLQWEQIFIENDKKNHFEELYDPEGRSLNDYDVHYISWGKQNYDVLTKRFGLPDDKAHIFGKISLDFYRNEFKRMWKSRDDVCRKYGISPEKPLVLFISSFTYRSDLPALITKSDLFNGQGLDVNGYTIVNEKSRDDVIAWLTKAAETYPDYNFIYRPHPTEMSHESVTNLAKTHSNIFVISDYPIGQWIVVSDMIYLWVSTSVCEVYMAGKKCGVLRPIEIPSDMDNIIFKKGSFITKCDDFIEDIVSLDKIFPVEKDWIEQFVFLDDKATYLKICDLAVRLLGEVSTNGNAYCKGKSDKFSYTKIINFIKRFLAYRLVMIDVGKNFMRKRYSVELYNEMVNDRLYSIEMREKNYNSQRIIRRRINELKKYI